MDLNKIPIFSVMTERLNWLGQRQAVLAQNIANANTPGYKPQDLKQPDFKSMVSQSQSGSGIGLARTQAGHIGGGKAGGTGNHKVIETDGQETTPTGNAVILEEQLMKTSETRMDYAATLNLYRKHVNMIKTAIGTGR